MVLHGQFHSQTSCRSAYLLANNAVSAIICKPKRQTDKDLDSITVPIGSDVSGYILNWEMHCRKVGPISQVDYHRFGQICWLSLSPSCPLRFCYNCFLSRESGYAACTYKFTVVDTLAETLPSVRELSVGCSPCIVVAVAGNSRWNDKQSSRVN